MSDPDVIFNVTTILKEMLNAVLKPIFPNDPDKDGSDKIDVNITISPPDYDSSSSKKRINLFLYRVTENSYLKNQEIPGTGNPGSYGHPPLSLDLHYLLVAFGDSETDAYAAHRLLGWAMKVFYDYPIITEGIYESTLGLEGSDLGIWDQFEKLKIVLDPISLEDLMKIWTALTKPYRISVAYTVSVVQIEGGRKRSLPRPLGEGPQIEAKVYAIPSRIPRIEGIHVYRRFDQNKKEVNALYASIGDTLIILGKNFVGDFRVILGSVDVTDQINFVRDDSRIELIVPDKNELQPGQQAVTIAFKMKMGKLHEEQEHTISNSNQGIFILTPRVDKFVWYPNEKVFRIFGSRLCDPRMECMTWIGDDEMIPLEKYIPQDDALDPNKKILPSDSITIPENSVTCTLSVGTSYEVRVRVNGAENIEIAKRLDKSQ